MSHQPEMAEIAELAEYADESEDMQNTLTSSYSHRLKTNDRAEVIDAIECPSTHRPLNSSGSDRQSVPRSPSASSTNGSIRSASTHQATRSASQTPVGLDDIKTLLQVFVVSQFRSREPDATTERIQSLCASLFSCDQETESLLIIGNQTGELSSTYPPQLLVPASHRVPIDRKRLQQLISKAKIARCRCRFPVPVVLFNDKYICRSATLSGMHHLSHRNRFQPIASKLILYFYCT
jgi:hypothetical protein